jgi:GrpB-like predicted nucleotidyltransferase (UPF0157 family)
VAEFESAGLGLLYGAVRLVPVRDEWEAIGADLCCDVAAALDQLAIAVEHVGSTAVPSMLAKPVLDLAVGVQDASGIALVQDRLEQRGWSYRGDAGEQGGHVFVLETRPKFRVAHVHVVEHQGTQWRRYLSLRTLLRDSPDARRRYASTKVDLAARFAGDNGHRQYTEAKGDVIAALLDDAPRDDART